MIDQHETPSTAVQSGFASGAEARHTSSTQITTSMMLLAIAAGAVGLIPMGCLEPVRNRAMCGRAAWLPAPVSMEAATDTEAKGPMVITCSQ